MGCLIVQFAWTVPTVRDRVVQTAVVLVLEPIFEADLQPEQYAYRRRGTPPDRSAQDAVKHVHRFGRKWLQRGRRRRFVWLL